MLPTASNTSSVSNTTVPATVAASETIIPGPLDHQGILKMSAEVFPGAKLELSTSIDPEIENWEHFVISVTVSGDVRDLVAGDRKWHHRLCAEHRDVARHYVLDLNVA